MSSEPVTLERVLPTLVTLHATVLTIIVTFLIFQVQTTTSALESLRTARLTAFMAFEADRMSCQGFDRRTSMPGFAKALDTWKVPRVKSELNNSKSLADNFAQEINKWIELPGIKSPQALEVLVGQIQADTVNREIFLDAACATLLSPPFAAGSLENEQQIRIANRVPVPPLEQDEDVTHFILLAHHAIEQLNPLLDADSDLLSVRLNPVKHAALLLQNSVRVFAERVIAVQIAQRLFERELSVNRDMLCLFRVVAILAVSIFLVSVLWPIVSFFPQPQRWRIINSLDREVTLPDWVVLVLFPFLIYVVLLSIFLGYVFK
jgi:hypothetical protein